MKRKQSAPNSQGEKKKELTSDLARWCIGAAAAANAACTAAQVRPEPPPEACPAGAQEVMKNRFYIDELSPGFFLQGSDRDEHRMGFIPVKEGPTSVTLLREWGELPPFTVLSGRFVFGPERVYGRFTEAHLPNGETVPVCFALWPTDATNGPQGLPIEGTVSAGTVKVWGVGRMWRVKRFE